MRCSNISRNITNHPPSLIRALALRMKKPWVPRYPLSTQRRLIRLGCPGLAHRSFVKYMGRVKQIWYLSPMRAAKVQASLRIRAVSPEPPLLAHTSSESRGTFRQKTRSLASLNGWACAVKICHDGMLEDTNSLDGAHIVNKKTGYLLVVMLQLKFIMSV